MNFSQSVRVVNDVELFADEPGIGENEPGQNDRADHECELDSICILEHGSSPTTLVVVRKMSTQERQFHALLISPT
jgi:hypothetical protein